MAEMGWVPDFVEQSFLLIQQLKSFATSLNGVGFRLGLANLIQEALKMAKEGGSATT